MEVKVTTPSLVRGAGVAAAMLVPGGNAFGRLLRTGLTSAGYVGSFAIDPQRKPVHYTLISFDNSAAVPQEVRKYANFAAGTASWIGISSVIGHLAAVLPLPRLVKALLVGGAVATGDAWVSDQAKGRGATGQGIAA